MLLDENIGIHCVDTPTPILLGLDLHRQLGCVVDYVNNSCWIYKQQRFLQIVVLTLGHLPWIFGQRLPLSECGLATGHAYHRLLGETAGKG